jgi:hypothetical protein
MVAALSSNQKERREEEGGCAVQCSGSGRDFFSRLRRGVVFIGGNEAQVQPHSGAGAPCIGFYTVK